MKYKVIGFTFFLTLSGHTLLSQSGSNEIPDHGLWPRPEIIPIPSKTYRVEDPAISLNGTWLINTSPSREYWNEKIDTKNWNEVIEPVKVKLKLMGKI